MNAITHAGSTMPLAEIAQFADVFVKSGVFKDARDVAKAIVKIQAGQELGLAPFAAMRGFDIVDGKLAPNAGLTAALVRRSGRYDYTIAQQDATACVLDWTDNGRAIGQSSFTIEEARAAGLTSKQVWKNYTSDLLFARALTRGCRRYCADVFLGSVYSVEELGADDAAMVVDHAPAPRKALPVAAPATDDGAPTFNGPGSFTEFAGDMVRPAAIGGKLESDAVESWRDLIEAADSPNAALKLWRRVISEEHEDYRRAGALRLAAERFATLLPATMNTEALEPARRTLTIMLDMVRAAATPKQQAKDRDRVLDLLAIKLATVEAMFPPADPGDDLHDPDADATGPVTVEELEGDL